MKKNGWQVPKLFDPRDVAKPIQLLAGLLLAAVALVGLLLAASAQPERSEWSRGLFSVAAVALAVGVMLSVLLLVTKYRSQMQEDPYYSQWLHQQQERFEGFAPESGETAPEANDRSSNIPGEQRRVQRYQENSGIFLIHSWRPSRTPGQSADIVVEPFQHREGPLSAGLVESVTYYLGPLFFGGNPITKRDAASNYRLEISAYGPVLCVAEIRLKGRKEPIVVDRYLDFADLGTAVE